MKNFKQVVTIEKEFSIGAELLALGFKGKVFDRYELDDIYVYVFAFPSGKDRMRFREMVMSRGGTKKKKKVASRRKTKASV